ncbi:transposase [Streptomyces sp. NPDC058877]|uniref:transposase n=1 Tax=Streptomyces sp. NPDC058877 TaxID=3346665 RepID=UPI0036B6ED26
MSSGRCWSRCCLTAGVSRRSGNRRRLIDGVRWRVRTGVPWRDLPPEYGPWQTVCGLFRRCWPGNTAEAGGDPARVMTGAAWPKWAQHGGVRTEPFSVTSRDGL